MRTHLLATILGWLLLVVPAQADEAKEARALLDRAIKAMGGKDKLTRYQAATWKGKGKVHAHGDLGVGDLAADWSVQGLDKYRWVGEATFLLPCSFELKRPFNLVLNRDKAWIKEGPAETQDLTELPEAVAFLRADLCVVRLAEMLVPLAGKEYRLSPLGELKIGSKDAVGIKAICKGQPDIDLFFDKKTHLPLHSEVRVKESASEEVLYSFYYGAYREIQGVKHFTTLELRRDNKPFVELELADVHLHERLGDETFDKP
jgi:hypothetical protein